MTALSRRTAAQALAAGRIGFGAAVTASPSLLGPLWLGSTQAGEAGTQVLGRALGMRDVTLGLTSWHALRSGADGPARAALLACAACDAVDCLTTLISRDRLAAGPAALSATVAALAAGVSVAGLPATGTTSRRRGLRKPFTVR